MMRGVRGWLLFGALIAAAVAVAARIPPLLRPPHLPAPVLTAPPPEDIPAAEIVLPELPGPEVLEPAFERPPMHQTRRPIEEPESPAPPEPQPEPLDAALWGIVVSAEERFAVIAARGASAGVRVRVGDLFDGWTVESISDNEVVLHRGDRIETIRLAFGAAPSGNTGD